MKNHRQYHSRNWRQIRHRSRVCRGIYSKLGDQVISAAGRRQQVLDATGSSRKPRNGFCRSRHRRSRRDQIVRRIDREAVSGIELHHPLRRNHAPRRSSWVVHQNSQQPRQRSPPISLASDPPQQCAAPHDRQAARWHDHHLFTLRPRICADGAHTDLLCDEGSHSFLCCRLSASSSRTPR